MEDFKTPTFLSQLPKLKALEISCARQLFSNPSNWPDALNTLSSTLESLSIKSEDSNFAFATNLEFDARGNVKSISSLRYLQIGNIFPQLTSLTLQSFNQNILFALPPGLTSLTAPGSTKLPFMSQLPRSMKHFNIGILSSSKPGANKLDDLAYTPSGMTIQHITVYDTSKQALEHIYNLEGLQSISLLDTVNVLSASEMRRLPRSITRMQLSRYAKLQEYGNTTLNWPSNLTSLRVECVSEPGDISHLPRHLKILDVRFPDLTIPILRTEELPPHLEEFSTGPYRMVHFQGKLPASVRCCGIYAMGDLSLDFLPDSLEELHLDTVIPFGLLPPVFPQLVQKINVKWWKAANLRDLPSSLTDLHIDTLDTSAEDTKHLFSLFPTGLKHLRIHEIIPRNDPHVFPYHANDLPSLTSLQISYAWLPLSSIKLLPRSLTTFQALLEKIVENPTFLAFLPPNLVHCRIALPLDKIKDLGEHWPPGSWRSLVGTSSAHHVRRLRQRLEASQSLGEPTKNDNCLVM